MRVKSNNGTDTITPLSSPAYLRRGAEPCKHPSNIISFQLMNIIPPAANERKAFPTFGIIS
jgi:hypothetical protein